MYPEQRRQNQLLKFYRFLLRFLSEYPVGVPFFVILPVDIGFLHVRSLEQPLRFSVKLIRICLLRYIFRIVFKYIYISIL